MTMRKYGMWQPEDKQTAVVEFKEGKTDLNKCFGWNGIPKCLLKEHSQGSAHTAMCDC